MKTIFMGTPDFAVPSLQKLIDSSEVTVEAVFTQPDKRQGRGKKLKETPIKSLAKKYDIDVYQPLNLKDEQYVDIIKKIEPDIIIVVAYGQILNKEILDIPKNGVFNVHASLLPEYRGAAPINWAIIDGKNKTGVTIMKVDIGLDTGDMLIKEEIKINEDTNFIELHDSLADLGASALIKAIEIIKNGKPKFIKQDNTKASYARKIEKKDGEIDWNKSKDNIIRFINGMYGWPVAFTEYKSIKMKIYNAIISKLSLEYDKYENGEIVKVNKDGIYIKVKDGLVIVKEIQVPGKKRILVKDYIIGNQIEKGVILGK